MAKKKAIKIKDEVKEEIEETRKEIKKDIILIVSSLVIICVVLGFIVAIRYFGNNKPALPVTNISKYNGFVFERKGDIWFTQILVDNVPYELMFYHPPAETDNISSINGLPFIFLKPLRVYISVDPTLKSQAVIAGTEISKVLGSIFKVEVKAGLTEFVNGSAYPKITCEQSSETKPVILLRLANETKIKNEGRCIIVEGTNEKELIRAADRLTYQILKIME